MPPDDTSLSLPAHGLTVRDVAKRYRISPDKVRALIKRGALSAINTASALCGRPRFVVLPHHLAAFEEQRRAAAPPPKPKRKSKMMSFIDYYPD
jgi:hypothetical protein